MRRWIAAIGIALWSAAAASPARADGQALFEANCAKCHGKTGLSDTPSGKATKAPHMKGDEKLQGDDVASVVLKTVRDPSKKKHVEVSKKVSDDDLAAIAVFVKALATAQ